MVELGFLPSKKDKKVDPSKKKDGSPSSQSPTDSTVTPSKTESSISDKSVSEDTKQQKEEKKSMFDLRNKVSQNSTDQKSTFQPHTATSATAAEQEKAQNAADHHSIDSKVRLLVEIITHDPDHTIYPHIDYDTNKVTFPILAKIGEKEDNVAFLEKLASDNVGILEKQIYERLLLCPDHLDGYAISLRLYCAKCSGIDIEKLHLIEHRQCGYIGERADFEINTPPKCPSCRNIIKDTNKELKVAGMWYECNGCNSKFDNPTMRLHCRKHNHDFTLNQSKSVVIPLFTLRKQASAAHVNTLSITPMIKRVLTSRDFAVEEGAMIKGKSGVSHAVTLYAYNRENKTIIIDVRSSDTIVSDTDVISTFVKVIDITPSIAIFVAIPGVSERVGAMLSNYSNTSIVAGKNFSEIVAAVERVLIEKLAPESGTTSVAPGTPKRIE